MANEKNTATRQSLQTLPSQTLLALQTGCGRRAQGPRPLAYSMGDGRSSAPNLLRSLGTRPCFALLTRALPACSPSPGLHATAQLARHRADANARTPMRRSGLSRHVETGLVR